MKILIASSICRRAMDRLGHNHELVCSFDAPEDELCRRIRGCEIVVFRSGVEISETVMSCAPELKLLIRAGSGLDNLDWAYASQKGLELVRIPEPGAQAVAELAFGHMLTLARQIRMSDEQLRRGHWTKSSTKGYLLQGKVLGIVGAGSIGTRVGQLGTAWGMTAIGCVERDRPSSEHPHPIQLTSFSEVLRQADFVSIHCPLKESTRNLIDAKALALMKRNAFLINLARGGVVDEDALYQALVHERRPAGAALDVHQHEGEGQISPFASLPNVVLTPHIGATTVDTQREIGKRIWHTVESFSARVSAETQPMSTRR